MNRKQNAKNLGDARFMPEAKQLSNLPGGPENTNPMNMRASGGEATPTVGGPSIYNDHNQNGAYFQMGTGHLDPTQYTPTGTSNTPMGVGNNSGFYYGKQDQVAPNAQEPMEGMRQAQEAANRGLMANPFLGMTGSPAVIPGAMDPSIPGQGAPLMQPMVTLEGSQTNKKRGDQ